MVEQGWTEEGGGVKLAMASCSTGNKMPLPPTGLPLKYNPYPPPLATYEDVVASPKLFIDTLMKLHAAMGTKFMIPIIGGKDLDLHRLFVEVTSRGGFGRYIFKQSVLLEKIDALIDGLILSLKTSSQVLGEKRWKEVTAVFCFPSSATNASFIARKYYSSLLEHYEQIYYFKAKGWAPCSADSMMKTPQLPASNHGLGRPRERKKRRASYVSVPASPEVQAAPAPPQPQRINAAESSQVVLLFTAMKQILARYTSTALGRLHRHKENEAYLIPRKACVLSDTSCPHLVEMEGKKSGQADYMHKENLIKLYPMFVVGQATPTPLTVTGVIDGKFDSGYLVTVTIGLEQLKGVLYHDAQQPARQVPQNNDASGGPRRRRRKKCEMKKRDPAHPKPNRSGYNFFFAEQHARLKPLHPGKDRDISRMIGELWNKLNDSEKVVYQEKALRDKERYKAEMEDYKERLRTGQIISNAVPIQQRPLEPDVETMELDERIETEGGDSPYTSANEFSSGKSDKTADEDSDMALGVEIGGANVRMDEAFGLQKRALKLGDEGKECLADVQHKTKAESRSGEDKESLLFREEETVGTQESDEKESMPTEEGISVPCEKRESFPVEDQ
ncbi:hypothetical protein RJ640_022070 [Escallonia rubra]|uniref:HMG box domain-containing protein n=1 Tax=Escallonia rubra TaxID=112253 RepID=A0AA88U985_9ASTE|nr:hypothetical protein RJ640_022070 [Escallonia rubra]